MVYKNKFVGLPPEILAHIFSYLSRQSLNQLSLACHCLHDIVLPSLYKTISLSFRTHIRQLELGIEQEQEDNILKSTVSHCTKHLILKSKQSGQHRLIQDIRSLAIHYLPHLKILTLTDFHMLSIHRITPLLSLLPQLEKININYCDLTNTTSTSTTTFINAPFFLQIPPTTATTTTVQQQQHDSNTNKMIKKYNNITSLELYWTDFTKSSMVTLLSCLPSLTSIHLNANHNRYVSANNQILQILPAHCPLIKDLEIGLQEVDEQTLTDCVAFYGHQLERLSIRSHGPLVLFAIAKHATQVKDLTIRFSLETKWYGYFNDQNDHSNNNNNSSHQSNDNDDNQDRDHHDRQGSLNPIINRLSTINELNQQQQRLEEQEQMNDSNNNNNNGEIEKVGGLLDILYWCQNLVRVQVVSMYNKTENHQQTSNQIPIIVKKALMIVEHRRQKMKTDHHHYNGNKLFAMEKENDNQQEDGGENDKVEPFPSINDVPLEHLASQSRGSFHIQPPTTSNGGAWIYHFDENMARQQYNDRSGKSILMEKILTFDDEQLHEIRMQFATLSV